MSSTRRRPPPPGIDDTESDSDSDESYQVDSDSYESESESRTDGVMNDFYNETTFPPGWLKLSEDEKRKKLDDELDKYMGRDVIEQLSQIKC